MSWQRVRGHDHLTQMFAQAQRRGRLAHAYLFTGPPGVGKRLFAGELAKALLCEDPPSDRLEACDQCPGCIQVEAVSHPDFFAVGRPEESPNIPIDVVRELCRNLSLKPVRGHGKVAIVDDADGLQDPITSHAAANAFLKTLEEPPPRSVLILIGTSADRQLSTIVSRCQVVRFAPLAAPLVGELLRAGGVTDAPLLDRLVRLSGGSPGQAQALADPALWDFRRSLIDGLTQPRPDSVALAKRWSEFVEEAGKESAMQRRRAGLALRLLIDFLGDALRLSLGSAPQLAEPQDQRALQELATRAGPERLLQLLDRCLEADMQLDRRVQLVLVLEGLLDAITRG
jgi:DNA polymerase III subunit delta'